MSERFWILRSGENAERFPARITYDDGVLLFEKAGRRLRRRLRVGQGPGEVHTLRYVNVWEPRQGSKEGAVEFTWLLVDVNGVGLLRLNSVWDEHELRRFCQRAGIRVDEDAVPYDFGRMRGPRSARPATATQTARTTSRSFPGEDPTLDIYMFPGLGLGVTVALISLIQGWYVGVAALLLLPLIALCVYAFMRYRASSPLP